MSLHTDGERLSKVVAKQQNCSRSQAEQYIENGHVSVDGLIITEPGFRVVSGTVTLAPDASLLPVPAVTFVLHLGADFKPDAPHPITEHSRWPQDPSPTRWHLRHHKDLRTFAPLERGMGGLIVLTQDWRVARKLQEDEAFLEHEFTIEVPTPVDTAALEYLNQRLDLRRWGLSLLKVSVGSSNEQITRLRVALKGYQLGVVAALCQEVRLKPISIKRLRLGRVSLAGLPAGQWRYLQDHERF
jgi:23S rRNA pseudouridine2604 synthase